MAFERGDVVLLPFPFTDQSTTKVRPAIVVSSSQYMESEPDIIVAGVTSRLAQALSPFDYALADWEDAGLRLPSALKPLLASIDPTLVLLTIGRLSPRDMEGVDNVLRSALSLPFSADTDVAVAEAPGE